MNDKINEFQYRYKYPRPMVTVDIALFSIIDSEPAILLIKRGGNTFFGYWALPGGFVDIEEDIKQTAPRELEEETGLKFDQLYQIFCVGTPGRDPRGRTISVVYSGFYEGNEKPSGKSDAKEAQWFNINEIPEQLAFDHWDVIVTVIKRWIYEFNNPSLDPCLMKYKDSFIAATKKYADVSLGFGLKL